MWLLTAWAKADQVPGLLLGRGDAMQLAGNKHNFKFTLLLKHMIFSRTLICLLVLFCIGWSKPSHAQQATPAATLAMSSPLLTAADTVAALQDLFKAKRTSSGLFLAATPVAAGLTGVGAIVAALSQSGSSPSVFPPLLVVGGGVTLTVALLSRYNRYTKGSEREVLNKYQQTRQLPRWVVRSLAKHRAVKS